MNPLTVANAVANGIVAATVAGMALRVFGDPNHQIHNHRKLFYIRKFISSVVICGAVLNIATLSTPSWTEVLLNYAFALNYSVSLFSPDRTTRPKHSSSSAKIPNQRSARGPRSAGKTASNPTASRDGRKRTATKRN